MPDDAECYIAADPEHDGCKYYFVDHTMQTVFWLEDIDPERHDIHLSPVCSVVQMSKLSLDFRPEHLDCTSCR